MCQQESHLGVLQVPMFFLICSVVMLLSVASSTAPLVLYWAAAALGGFLCATGAGHYLML
jgi:hypothetical protein